MECRAKQQWHGISRVGGSSCGPLQTLATSRFRVIHSIKKHKHKQTEGDMCAGDAFYDGKFTA
jgi:hypothetical protein